MAWTAPRTWVAGEVVTAALMNTHVRDNLLEALRRDGLVALTAAWDAGSYQIRAETFQSDIATGTAPFTVASTTIVTNLNADQVDGQSRAININADHTHQSTGAEAGKLDHGLALDGLTDDDHTQYQKENLLTTAGDLPYATASSTWQRLGIGTAAQVLRVNAGATAPEWGTQSFTSKLIQEGRTAAAASGDVSYTGYGFQPKALIVFAINDVASSKVVSIGFGDVNLAEASLYTEDSGADIVFARGATQIIYCESAAGDGQIAVLKTLDADGFTLTWTKTGNGLALTFLVLALS